MVGHTLHAAGRGYVQLALKLGLHDPKLVDAFYGPVELRPESSQSAEYPIPDIIRAASTLRREVLSIRDEDPLRRHYLAANLQALVTRARVVQGEPISLETEMRDCYGLAPVWTPEAQLAALHAELADLLPSGPGSVAERYQRHVQERAMPAADALTLLTEQILPPLRERTARLFPLPREAAITVSLARGVTWTAYNFYLGGLQATVQFNADKPLQIPALPSIGAHEGWAGHATDLAIHEKRYAMDEDRAEHTISVFGSPWCTVGEAWAMSALSVLMTPAEILAWLEELFARTGKSQLQPAREQRITDIYDALRATQGNMAIMMQRGDPDDAVLAYGKQWRLATDAEAASLAGFIRVFGYAYPFTYFAGRVLLDALFQRPEGVPYWANRVLTEPVTPALLRAWTAEGPEGIAAIDRYS